VLPKNHVKKKLSPPQGKSRLKGKKPKYVTNYAKKNDGRGEPGKAPPGSPAKK